MVVASLQAEQIAAGAGGEVVGIGKSSEPFKLGVALPACVADQFDAPSA